MESVIVRDQRYSIAMWEVLGICNSVQIGILNDVEVYIL